MTETKNQASIRPKIRKFLESMMRVKAIACLCVLAFFVSFLEIGILSASTAFEKFLQNLLRFAPG